MSLFLAESILPVEAKGKVEIESVVEKLSEIVKVKGGVIVEVQVSQDFSKAFFILQIENAEKVKEIYEEANIELSLVKEVRLIGQELEGVLQENKEVRYIVEWNLPADLTMDRYLQRKKENSIKYEEVPEVEFIRTYVCEDMTKCVCFYNAPDVETVEKARKVVGAPIDALTETIQIKK